MSKQILLIEDEPGLVLTLTDRLKSEGYDLTSATDGEDGCRRALTQHFDLILLDLMLPGKSGFDVCRDLRRAGLDVPILMLTARSQLADKVVGLKIGADDYLTKPFEMMELLARVEALLRRTPVPSEAALAAGVYRFGAVRVDFRRAEVLRDGQSVELSPRELRLLQHFIENRGVVLTRDELLDKVWGYDAMPQTRTVDVHVAGLRQKLEEHPRLPKFILTVHGIGYKFIG
jgi:two-component system alkaline phosphatase synthesis response regulator PhoP